MKIKNFTIFLVALSLVFSINHSQLLSNEKYITGEDGVIRMYINVMGHVKNPGTHLVYDNIDFMSALSMAGGYVDGANLKKINIYSEDGSKQQINLKNILNSKSKVNRPISNIVKLKPHDTIYIEQTVSSRLFVSSNLPALVLGIINLAITLENIQDQD